jgi:SWI/SNF-related matrix-associated actin-dependent regulator 1 of chromatin subfamily A
MEPDVWRNRFLFGKRYCKAKRTPFGWEFKGAENLDELKRRISHLFVMREKKDVLPQLPPLIETDLPIGVPNDVLLELSEICRETSRERSYQEAAVALGKMRQVTSMAKLDACIELVESRMAREKVIVFSCYNEPLRQMGEIWGNRAVTVTGKVGERDRELSVREFQENPDIRVFLGGMNSAGVGITLTAAKTVVFLDYSFVPADHDQAAARHHRLGQKHDSVEVIQLWAKGTIDETMRGILHGKRDVIEQLFGDGPGQERTVIESLSDALGIRIRKGGDRK